MKYTSRSFRLLEDATNELITWVHTIQSKSGSPFEAAEQIATLLGAHYRNGYAEIGFWVPELVENDIDPANAYLELLTPEKPLDFDAAEQEATFSRERINLVQDGEYLWGAVEGMTPGTREQIGTFYWVKYRDNDDEWHTVADHMAYSIPFGVFGPAEFYDFNRLDGERGDKAHFDQIDYRLESDGVARIGPPVNILQIHVGTASDEGTLAGLNRIYQGIAAKIERGEPLAAWEENYTGYDAIQLMPIEPPIEHEGGPPFWEADDDHESDRVNATLRRHDIINWGYDVMISGSAAPNPAVLESKRPDELLDLIVTLHNFPGKPIGVIFDIVYGHTDYQAVPLLNAHFLAGANMYGYNLNYLHPSVRAILLEMQRRKHNYGVDGVRVDGAQDFKWWDAESETLRHDDAYLRQMNNIVQDVAGHRYRPWMIFEDGRPWPRDDWELSSTYRKVTEQMPNVWQWGPLTFAHNTPFLFTFWISKWWRIQELTQVGSQWITGCANHDTLRRGTQVDPKARINTYLGDTLPEILRNAYDNPAAKLFDYTCMPGVPMDFINASMRAPWSFIRNTDERYGVKVASEEARFLDWAMDEFHFAQEATFSRLKMMGFTELPELHRFMHTLDYFVQSTDYNLPMIVKLLETVEPKLPGGPFSVDKLKQIAMAWMEDVHDYCKVTHFTGEMDPERTAFDLKVREFRRQRSWLMADFKPDEHFDYLRPVDGTILFYGLRRAPDDSEQILFVANMEGAPRTILPIDLPIPNLSREGWQTELVTPVVRVDGADHPITLHDSQGIVFVRNGA